MSVSHELLDAYLEAAGADGYLLEADSSVSSQRYLSEFDAPDSFLTLYTPDGIHLLLAGMEAPRARKDSVADTVTRNEEFGGEGRIRHFGTEENSAVISGFLESHGINRVAVPDWTPVGTGDAIRDRGHELVVDTEDVLLNVRAKKSDEEIGHIREAQQLNQEAMAHAERILETADVVDGVLYSDGEVLTSEQVRSEIEIFLLRNGYDHAESTPIVACGEDAADPHSRGQGPLSAGETIIVDIFPRNRETGYYADLTRTFLKGEPPEAVAERYRLVEQAQKAALKTIAAGVEAQSVHDRVCDVFEDAGYETVRSSDDLESGFTHRTGHGIGLDLHENPRLSSKGGTLEPGMVVTVEPGLYDPAVGGVRIEDLVVVTEDGHENLTDYEKRLEL